MANPTTDMRVETRALGLFTISRHPDARLKTGGNWPDHLGAQVHKLAGIRPIDGWDRAGAAEGRFPGWTDQPAFFMVTAAIIITIEILTFRTGRSFHIFNFPIISLKGRKLPLCMHSVYPKGLYILQGTPKSGDFGVR